MNTDTMNTNTLPRAALIPIALMALTRIHGDGAWPLPDASLAAFFMAGLLVGGRWLLAVLLVEAAVLDYLAVTWFGVSPWCLSPAYVFLLPTYAVLWQAGRHSANAPLAATLGWAVLAVAAAFVISNASFYLFSGRYGGLAAVDYLAAVAGYFPPYLGAALLYSLPVVLAAKAKRARRWPRQRPA